MMFDDIKQVEINGKIICSTGNIQNMKQFYKLTFFCQNML